MTSPMISKSSRLTDKVEYCGYNKMIFYYAVLVFALLLLCKPAFVMTKLTINDDDLKLSYPKLFLWEIILCLPFIFHYIINN